MEDFDITEDMIGIDVIIAYNELIQLSADQPPDFMQMKATILENLKGAIKVSVVRNSQNGPATYTMIIPKSRLRFIGVQSNITVVGKGVLDQLGKIGTKNN